MSEPPICPYCGEALVEHGPFPFTVYSCVPCELRVSPRAALSRPFRVEWGILQGDDGLVSDMPVPMRSEGAARKVAKANGQWPLRRLVSEWEPAAAVGAAGRARAGHDSKGAARV